jgi:hypothetical protein
MASNVTSTSGSASSSLELSVPPFGSGLFPTVILSLGHGNRTDPKCVTINGLELCSTIDSCPLEWFRCDVDVCEFRLDMCRCSATYGSRDCDCRIDGLVASDEYGYWVSPTVSCGGGGISDSRNERAQDAGLPDLYVRPANLGCLEWFSSGERGGEGQAETCDSGDIISNFEYEKRPGIVMVNWKCSVVDGNRSCRCEAATFGDKPCETCLMCGEGPAAAFRLECPDGFYTNCTDNGNIATYTLPTSSAPGAAGREAATLALGAIAAAALLPLWLLPLA